MLTVRLKKVNCYRPGRHLARQSAHGWGRDTGRTLDRMDAGKLVTLGILGLALVLGVFAWTYHKSRSDRAIDYWGAENAVRVRRAPRLSLSRLRRATAGAAEADATQPVIQIDGETWQVEPAIDITEALGLVHLRQALVENGSFDWSRPRGGESLTWDYLMRFEEEGPDATPLEVAIGLDSACLQCLDGRPTVGLRIAPGVRSFLTDALPQESQTQEAAPHPTG